MHNLELNVRGIDIEDEHDEFSVRYQVSGLLQEASCPIKDDVRVGAWDLPMVEITRH